MSVENEHIPAYLLKKYGLIQFVFKAKGNLVLNCLILNQLLFLQACILLNFKKLFCSGKNIFIFLLHLFEDRVFYELVGSQTVSFWLTDASVKEVSHGRADQVWCLDCVWFE